MKKVNLHSEKRIGDPYRTPENYFDQLEHRIHEAVTDDVVERPILSMKWAVVPAFLIVMALTLVMITNRPADSGAYALIAQVPQEEILAYLEYMELSTGEIASLSESPDDLLIETSTIEDDIELNQELLDEFLYELEEVDETSNEKMES